MQKVNDWRQSRVRQFRLTSDQVRDMLILDEIVVRKPVKPGRGQNWLRQESIDSVKEFEFDGGEWLILKHPAGEGNLTCIRNVIGRVGDLVAHRTLTMRIKHITVEREKSLLWVIWLKRVRSMEE